MKISPRRLQNSKDAILLRKRGRIKIVIHISVRNGEILEEYVSLWRNICKTNKIIGEVAG